MTKDARFEDGAVKPMHLKAFDADDLQVISALSQDAVFPASEIKWEAKQRRFSILLNRFRWEDASEAERRKRNFERVQAVLTLGDASHVASQGLDPSNKDVILSLLSIAWEPGEDGTGRVILTLSGDGAIAVSVECLDVTLKDVTRPYLAPSRKRPEHPEA